MWAKRHLDILQREGIEAAKEHQKRVFGECPEVIKLIIPHVHDILKERGVKK